MQEPPPLLPVKTIENKHNLYIFKESFSDSKLKKTIMDSTTLNGLAAGIGWIAKKVVKENFTANPSSKVMNYAKFTAVMAGSVTLKQVLEEDSSDRLKK